MGALTQKNASIFNELEAAVLQSVERVGLDKLPRAELVRQFAGRGPSSSALYRWITAIVESGRPGQQLAAKVRAAIAERDSSSDSSEAAVEEIAAKLPRRVTVGELCRGIDVMRELDRLWRDLELVAAHARTPDGAGVRLPLLLLKAAELRRRWIETALNVHRRLTELDQVESFHRMILAEIALESPELQQRILLRLDRLAAGYSVAASASASCRQTGAR